MNASGVRVDAGARPLLAAASVVLGAGIVAAAVVSTRAEAVTARLAGASVDVPHVGAAMGPPTTSRPMTVVLGVVVPTTVPPPVAPTTTATLPAAAAQTAMPTPTTVASPPPPAPPTTAPAPPGSAAVDTGCEGYLVDRTNATRSEHGLAPLAWDGRPHAIARDWSAHMAEIADLEHNRRYGQQLSAAGVPWRAAGENVGRGDVVRVFELWMASSTHRPNILSTAFTSFAVACVSDGTQVWVTQDFFG